MFIRQGKTNWKYIFILTIVAIFVGGIMVGVFELMRLSYFLPPFQQIQSVKDETAGWQTYRNEQYGFEIKYPSDFLISFPTSVKRGAISETRFTQKNWDQGYSHPSISIEIFKTNIPAKQWIENEFPIGSSSQGEPYQGRGKDISEGEVSGYAVLRFDRFFASGSTQDAVFKNGNILIDIIDGRSPNGDNTDIYNQMLATFKFIE